MANDDVDVPTVPYQALYRRFRPQQFSAVVGQEHVTRALRHAVRDGKVAHAYLFSGPRGTGKTSTARILAMALNCEHPVDGEPDGTCPSCVAIRQGSSLDVQELDSATNRGIDEMRDLLGRVALSTPGRWKVYIIDEVHQMTPAAASALLKTLEEPPGHVIFVLATTDPQKVLPTIRSRTQHFEFHLLSADVLTSLIRDVANQAALGIAPEAVDLVVRRGHGSARDALSALDQVAAAGGIDDDGGGVSGLVDALADRDPGRVLTEVAAAVAAGRDARPLGTELLEQLRNGFLATQARPLVLLPDDAVAVVEAQARRFGTPALVRAMELVGQALIDMRDAPDPRITLEVALVRLADPDADDSRSALLERLERLERLVAERGEQESVPIPAVRSLSQTAAFEPRPAVGPPPVTAGGGQSALGAHRRSRDAAPVGPPPSTGDQPPPPATQPSGSARPPLADQTGPAGAPPGSVPAGAPPGSVPAGAPPGSVPAGAPPGSVPAGAPPGSVPAGAPPGSVPAGAPPGSVPAGAPPGSVPAGAPPGSVPAGAPPGSVPAGAPPGSVPAGAPPGSVPAGAPPGSLPAGAPPGSLPAGAPPGSLPAGALPGSLPAREALTVAWGDTILPALRPGVKVYVSAGRFVGVDDGAAIFALPDKGLLSRAEPNRPEVEAALAAHFGRPVPLRLVLDEPGQPGARLEPPTDDLGAIDLDDLEDAPVAVVSPEQRLLQAFPGAEEVSP